MKSHLIYAELFLEGAENPDEGLANSSGAIVLT
jgi:hypothetical protein